MLQPMQPSPAPCTVGPPLRAQVLRAQVLRFCPSELTPQGPGPHNSLLRSSPSELSPSGPTPQGPGEFTFLPWASPR